MNDHPVVIVTGASRGVGAAVARWLAKVKAGVTLVARSLDDLKRVAGDIHRLGGDAVTFKADVADHRACRRVVEKTLDHFGRIDALVNNAGVFQPVSPIRRADPDAWRYNLEVNILGVFFMCQAAIPQLKEQRGRIVNVSSGAATSVIEAGSAYCASKAALNHFTKVLAAEEPEITAVSVRPGVVDTEMQALIRRKGPEVMPKKQIASYLNPKTRGQLEPPMVPARSIAWLALNAPAELSGMFLNYDDPQIISGSSAVFGKSLE